ncbi:hypothetical protein GQ54DRAFT_295870 [Martensiomyces pterosporus]|nr:hypothetical protein GQ54DRAFT_295870 [Martensiomyces pterosporus]
MARFTPVFLLVLARFASVASAQECTGNTAMCPNNQDGVSSTYLQCNSWSQQYESSWSGQYVNSMCPANLTCYNNDSNTGVFCE